GSAAVAGQSCCHCALAQGHEATRRDMTRAGYTKYRRPPNRLGGGADTPPPTSPSRGRRSSVFWAASCLPSGASPSPCQGEVGWGYTGTSGDSILATRQTRTLARTMMAPAVFVLFIWMIVPLVMTVWFSFQNYSLINPMMTGFAGWA